MVSRLLQRAYRIRRHAHAMPSDPRFQRRCTEQWWLLCRTSFTPTSQSRSPNWRNRFRSPARRRPQPPPPSPLSHPAPGKNKIIPNRNSNAANNCTPMCQRIKNEVAQHSENTIFSLMNVRWGNKEAECYFQGRDAISVRWGGYLKSPENSVHT